MNSQQIQIQNFELAKAASLVALENDGFGALTDLMEIVTLADINALYGQSLKTPASMLVRCLKYRQNADEPLTLAMFKEFGMQTSPLLDKEWRDNGDNLIHMNAGTVPEGLDEQEQQAFRKRANASLRMRQVFFIHHASMLHLKRQLGHNLSDKQTRLCDEVWPIQTCQVYFIMFQEMIRGENLQNIPYRKDQNIGAADSLIGVPQSVRQDAGLAQWCINPWGLVRR